MAGRLGGLLTRERAEPVSELLSLSSNDAVVRKTLDGIVVGWNEAAEELFGYSEKEMIGQTIRQLVPADRQKEEDAILTEIAAGHAISHLETVRLRKDGQPINVIVTILPIRDKSGKIAGAKKIARGISPGKLVEERIRESQAVFQATFENAAVGMAHVAPDGSWVRVNECLCEITGYSKEELLSKTFQDITHPEDLKADLEHVERMLSGEINSYRIEKRYLRKNRSVVWVRLTVSCFRSAEGAVNYFISVVEDISRQKEAEEQLRRQADLLDQSHDAILVWKLGGAITYWSPGAERLYGWRPEEAIGRRSHDLLRTSAQLPMHEVEALIERNGQWLGELTHTTRLGRKVIVESRHVRVRYGDELYALETNRDITDRKEAEEKIQFLMREAHHRSKNVLSVVQAIARQTSAATIEEFVARFQERLHSLAKSQDLLVRNEWMGTELSELVCSQLGHFGDLIGTRIELRGLPLRINAEAAQVLGMALHELSTNAAKYGALTDENGRISVEWACGEIFTITWRERSGKLLATPSRQGFGSIVLRRMVSATLDGKVELAFEDTGLFWRVECPAVNVLEESAARREG
jgi:PAS domain S-box-containing protein